MSLGLARTESLHSNSIPYANKNLTAKLKAQNPEGGKSSFRLVEHDSKFAWCYRYKPALLLTTHDAKFNREEYI